jgi:transposase-like protein
VIAHDPGRPVTDPADVARRLAGARQTLGPHATVDAIAEHLDVSPRTVRRWQKVSG